MVANVILKFLKQLAPVKIASLVGVALLTSGVGQTSSAQGSIDVTPNVVDIGQATSVTLSASGFFDLTQVKVTKIGIRPDNGVSNLSIASATAQKLVLSFQLSEDATPGTRTLFINDPGGNTVVALDLVLRRPSHLCMPQCQSPKVCRSNQCILPDNICQPQCVSPKECRNNQCILPDDVCQPRCVSPEKCRNNQCILPAPPRCEPKCTGIKKCNEFGRCEIPI